MVAIHFKHNDVSKSAIRRLYVGGCWNGSLKEGCFLEKHPRPKKGQACSEYEKLSMENNSDKKRLNLREKPHSFLLPQRLALDWLHAPMAHCTQAHSFHKLRVRVRIPFESILVSSSGKGDLCTCQRTQPSVRLSVHPVRPHLSGCCACG